MRETKLKGGEFVQLTSGDALTGRGFLLLQD
jgi:hypothetical protein